MRIYLDTNLWNELCDQNVEAQHVLEPLSARNGNLILSYQVVYELARCFTTLNRFVQRNIRCVTEITEVLAAEMWGVRLGKPPEIFLNSEAFDTLRSNVGALAGGDFDERAKTFVEERAALARHIRSSQAEQLTRRPDVRERLKLISDKQLPAWLAAETRSSQGVALLVEHIRRQFSDAPPRDAYEWAVGLLTSGGCNLSKALVRADLYYNWRCARRGSNPKDLYDDIYHVLNAIYCDIYTTKEQGHAKYAGLLLTTSTKVAIYEGQTPLADWLLALAEDGGPSARFGA